MSYNSYQPISATSNSNNKKKYSTAAHYCLLIARDPLVVPKKDCENRRQKGSETLVDIKTEKSRKKLTGVILWEGISFITLMHIIRLFEKLIFCSTLATSVFVFCNFLWSLLILRYYHKCFPFFQ